MFRVHIMISGEVQGVWFRVSAQDKAKELKLTGWVKNLNNGSVSLEVVGEDSQLKLFKNWLHTGSPLSEVEHVEFNLLNNIQNPYKDFKIVL